MIRTLPSCYNAGDVVYCYFPAYDANGASLTITGLAVTDIEIYKNGGTTQRASDNGYTLLDTDGIDFDGSTGLHGFKVDTSDNSDAGFWADGNHYLIWVDAVTINGQTVRFGFDLCLGYLLRPTTAGRKLDVSSGGEAGVDWANVGTPGSTVNLSATTVNLVNTLTTYTGNTPQTGDAFARLGAPAGASVSADILTIDNLVDDLESRLGSPSNLGSGATVAANLVDIEAQTDDIGAAGVGLTAVPWNPAWDAEVQSEVADALDSAVPATPTANSINERLKTMDDADIPGRLPAALVGGRMDSSVGAMAAGVITAAAHSAGAIDAAAIATGAITAAKFAAGAIDAAAIADNAIDAAAIATGAITAAKFAAGAIDAAAIADNAIDAATIATGAITAAKFAAGAIDAAALAADVINDIWAGTALTESYRAAGAAGTPAQLLYEVLQNLTEFAISGTTKTVKKLDGSTTAKTYTLDSATVPTSITETT